MRRHAQCLFLQQFQVTGIIHKACEMDNALGCLLGVAVGDSAGAPLEFTANDHTIEPGTALAAMHMKGKKSRLSKGRGQGRLDLVRSTCQHVCGLFPHSLPAHSSRAHLLLQVRGQVTDDTELAICLARGELTMCFCSCCNPTPCCDFSPRPSGV